MRWSGSITKAEGLAVSMGQTHESRGAWFNILMCSWEVIYTYFSFIGPCNPFTVSETVRLGIWDPAYLQCLRLLPGAPVSASRPFCCPFLCLECPACLPGEQLPHLSYCELPLLNAFSATSLCCAGLCTWSCGVQCYLSACHLAVTPWAGAGPAPSW